jgi:hypothetical protein
MNDPMQTAAARHGRRRESTSCRAGEDEPSDQLDIFAAADDGRQRRDDGMRTAEHAAHPWVKVAVDGAIARRAASRVPFVSDDVRDDVPFLSSHPNVLGARFNAAARRGEIVKTGAYRQSRNASRHGGVVAEWVGA